MQQALPFITAKLIGNSRSRLQNVLLPEPRLQVNFFENDGPGGHSHYGPRHDNDCTYIHEIRILPTADECLSTTRRPWMPQKNVNSPHYIVHGPSRHLDIHFRLLRHDSTEKIRDINYHAAQVSFLGHVPPLPPDGKFLETPIGNRYFLYQDLRVQDLIAHERHGIVIQMSFPCPGNLRGSAMRQSTRLERGMLVAVLCLNHDSQQLSIHYLEVLQRESTYSSRARRQGSDRAAVQLALLPDARPQEMEDIMRLIAGIHPYVTLALVEYPSTLYQGFANPLRCLRTMSHGDYAFAHYISPPHGEYLNASSQMLIHPPLYTMHLDHKFDFSPLTGKEESIFTLQQLTGPGLSDALQHLAEYTTLDQGQSVALLSSLVRELAFTQGPPGTGKTFLSVALTRVLLASRSKSKAPILLVCRTNHALDAFLAGLKNAGVEKLLRIGGSSREDWTKEINIREITHKQKLPQQERAARFNINKEKQSNWMEIESWCKGLTHEALTSYPSWQQISTIVAKESAQTYTQLITNVREPKAQTFIFEYWARGGDLTTIQSLQEELAYRLDLKLNKDGLEDTSVEEKGVQKMLEDVSRYTQYHAIESGPANVWSLSLPERQQLLRRWQANIDKGTIVKELIRVQAEHGRTSQAIKSLHDDQSIRIMQEHNIVGMTTTACAGRWEMLRKVGFEIMICEEAGEVLEAHALCTLLPSLQHAISIGDPLQLRPTVDQQSLAMEARCGHNYRLDESLFERMMQPVDVLAKPIPMTRLDVQRRMHPDISEISRITYPYLQDHPDTTTHPVPKGLSRRMWWFDHSTPEDTITGVSKSTTNEFESQVVKALVAYLLRGSDYSPGNIAVLTPYAGQVARLRVLLSELCNIWISDKDKEELISTGIIDAEDEFLGKSSRLTLSLKNMLKLATIDNFQGEEAKVIILSTVRSGHRLGFVKCPNRINVACSRARDGFYVVGNSEALASNPIWASILEVFSEKDAVQQYISLQCDRHSEHTFNATTPHEIATFPACQVTCGQTLSCSHTCPEPCHDAALHNIISCNKPCIREFPCGHICEKLCYEECGSCKQQSHRVEGSCGHSVLLSCNGEAKICDHFRCYLDLSCGRHAVALTCGGKTVDSICDTACGLQLACGHYCEGICGVCHVGSHPRCSAACGETLFCDHKCTAICHDGPCPPCKEICQPQCEHTVGTRVCSDPLKLCMESVSMKGLATVCALTNLSLEDIDGVLQQVFLALMEKSRELLAAVDKASKSMTQSHSLFMITLDARALAAGQNINNILKRHDDIAKIQQDINGLKAQLSWTQAGVDVLNKISGRSLSLDSSVATKIEEIELHAVCARSKDTIMTIPCLLKMKDQSMQMRRLAQELQTFVKEELKDSIERYDGRQNWTLDDSIATCKKLLDDVEALAVE